MTQKEFIKMYLEHFLNGSKELLIKKNDTKIVKFYLFNEQPMKQVEGIYNLFKEYLKAGLYQFN